MAINSKFGKLGSSKSAPKSTLNKGKMQPFGVHFVTKLNGVNNKLVCSLSARAVCDVVTDNQDER